MLTMLRTRLKPGPGKYSVGRVLFLFCAALLLWASPCIATAAARRDDYSRQIKPLLSKYCYSCHDDAHHRSDLSLEKFKNPGDIRKEVEVWAEVLRKLGSGEMPPANKPQPSPSERERVVEWIQAELFPVDCDHPDPGRVTIRRLNRAEYNNTIRDLVGVDFQPAANFPLDDTGYGFDNIGDALTLSPLLLEKYLAAAETILNRALVVPEALQPPRLTFAAAKFGHIGGASPREPDTFSIYSAGEVFIRCSLTNSGQFAVRVLASAQQAGPELARMALRVDGREAQSFDVEAAEASPRYYEKRLQLKAGKHRVAAAFLNDYYKESDPDPSKRDRNLLVHAIEISGPLDVAVPVPETHRRIFFVQPERETTNVCARQIISRFASAAFRRPVAPDELARLADLAEAVWKSGASFELGIKVALQAVLISPHFLFRGELQPSPNDPSQISPVDEYALASRLSYLLWSSMPDEELFALAAKGELRSQLEPQVRRMLLDPKSKALVTNFAGQWLQTRTLKQVAPDPVAFPAFDEELRAAMATETEQLFQYIMEGDRSVIEFITADYSFLNDRLARHYGIAGVSGPEFRKVSLKGTGRGGVMTHGSVLTLTSNPTRTSPVKRGKWVLENLLGQAPPPPPPGVPPLKESREDTAAASLRSRLELHRADPLCASCHSIMDPIGFSLEHFDPVGAWRDQDGPFPIDPSGQLNTGEKFSGAPELRDILARSRRDRFVKCLVEKMLTYALGRGLERYDSCAVDRVSSDLARQNFRFSALVLGVVKSAPFQLRRGEGDPAEPPGGE